MGNKMIGTILKLYESYFSNQQDGDKCEGRLLTCLFDIRWDWRATSLCVPLSLCHCVTLPMAGSGGLAQQVAEKLADLIQVRILREELKNDSSSPGQSPRLKQLCFSVKFMKVAEGKVLLEVDEVGGWLDVR